MSSLLLDYDASSKKVWSLIWRWSGPHYIQNFLWLVAKNRLLTNVERVRRHLGGSEICSVCGSDIESVSHVLRDCVAAKVI